MRQYVKTVAKWILEDRLFVQRLPRSCENAAVLTFDDGPHASLTPKILDMLDDYHARACFFVVGAFAEKEPRLLAEIVNRGHVVGNHSYAHGRADLGFTSHAEDVYRCQRVIRDITGVTPSLFRPPQGRLTMGGIMASRRVGATMLLWSIQGGEFSFAKNQSESEISRRLADGIKGRDVILLHDNSEKTVTILEHILPIVQNRGLDLRSGVGSLVD